MGKHYAAVKFFLRDNRVALLTLLKEPVDPKKLKILKDPEPTVTLPDDKRHTVVKARGLLVPSGDPKRKWLLAVLEYDPSKAAKSAGPRLGTSAEIEVTISNDPEEIPINVEDPAPAPGDGPPIAGDIELLA